MYKYTDEEILDKIVLAMKSYRSDMINLERWDTLEKIAFILKVRFEEVEE